MRTGPQPREASEAASTRRGRPARASLASPVAAGVLSATLLAAIAPSVLDAARLEVRLVDQKGKVAEAGVVVAVPVGVAAGEPAAGKAIMDQIDEAFVPQVLPVAAGTEVSFPNQDDIRHHVYSFSETKKFELPLYKGTAADPVVFDRPGVVVLGCNIHDHMRGYIYVAESPYFAVVGEEGTAAIDGLPDGEYELRVWHPQQKKEVAPQKLRVGGAAPAAVELAVDLKPSLRRRGSAARGKKY